MENQLRKKAGAYTDKYNEWLRTHVKINRETSANIASDSIRMKQFIGIII